MNGNAQRLLESFPKCKDTTPSVEPRRRRISMEAWSDPNRPKTIRRRKMKSL
jgi:hypothetical protein